MKYFLIAKKDNVIKIIPFKESYVYSSSDDGLFYEDTLLIKNIDGASIYKISDNLIQIFDTEKGYYYLNDRFNVVKSNFYIIPNKKYKFLIAQASPIRISMGVYKKSIYFLNENLTNEEGLIIDDNYNDLITYTEKILILGNKNELYGYNIQPFNPLWQFSLSSLGKFKNLYTNEEETIEVRQFIGVYNNILWLFLNKTGFIGLDITTGILKHHISKNNVLIGETAVTSYTENDNGRMSFFRSQYYLDEQKGKIIGLAVDMLFEMDLNRDTPCVTQYGLQKQYQKYGINEQNIANDFVLKDNLLYFYAFNQLKFGILNIKTKEIIYISEPIIPENNKITQLKDLQVSDNKIYILDSGNTLHIFEK